MTKIEALAIAKANHKAHTAASIEEMFGRGPKVDESKFTQIKKNSQKQVIRYALTGLVFGFFTEWLLGNGRIYDNIVKKRMSNLSVDF